MRIKRKIKNKTFDLGRGFYLKFRLVPKIQSRVGCIWVFGMAISKSKKQINRFLASRKNKLTGQKTGRTGFLSFSIAVKQIHEWLSELPENDQLLIQCETLKQYKIYKKRILKKEKITWYSSDKKLLFIAASTK